MKRKSIFYSILIVTAAVFFQSCKKDDGSKPGLTTLEVTVVTDSTANSGGTITSDGGSDITEKGICWSAGRVPTVKDHKTSEGSGPDQFTSSMANLAGNTTYYVSAYATNKSGTGYGEAISFKTPGANGPVVDIDGNSYDTVVIGSQVWLMQNLRVTHYRNGDPIDSLDDATQWCNTITGAFCDYDNDPNNVPFYGRLYNSYAVTDSRGIAPQGWHIATEAEWQTLIDYLGGSAEAGGKLKEKGFLHWESPNSGASNGSGFQAIPAGYRFGQYGIPGYGQFINLGKYAYWWASSGKLSCELGYDSPEINLNTDVRLSDGFSVRCVKNP